jgi:hypothetical protein
MQISGGATPPCIVQWLNAGDMLHGPVALTSAPVAGFAGETPPEIQMSCNWTVALLFVRTSQPFQQSKANAVKRFTNDA